MSEAFDNADLSVVDAMLGIYGRLNDPTKYPDAKLASFTATITGIEYVTRSWPDKDGKTVEKQKMKVQHDLPSKYGDGDEPQFVMTDFIEGPMNHGIADAARHNIGRLARFTRMTYLGRDDKKASDLVCLYVYPYQGDGPAPAVKKTEAPKNEPSPEAKEIAAMVTAKEWDLREFAEKMTEELGTKFDPTRKAHYDAAVAELS